MTVARQIASCRVASQTHTVVAVALSLSANARRILCTGANAGLIETLTDALSIDAVKKQHGSLWRYFTHLFGDERSLAFQTARQTFAASMAASSVFCYLFQVRDAVRTRV